MSSFKGGIGKFVLNKKKANLNKKKAIKSNKWLQNLKCYSTNPKKSKSGKGALITTSGKIKMERFI